VVGEVGSRSGASSGSDRSRRGLRRRPPGCGRVTRVTRVTRVGFGDPGDPGDPCPRRVRPVAKSVPICRSPSDDNRHKVFTKINLRLRMTVFALAFRSSAKRRRGIVGRSRPGIAGRELLGSVPARAATRVIKVTTELTLVTLVTLVTPPARPSRIARYKDFERPCNRGRGGVGRSGCGQTRDDSHPQAGQEAVAFVAKRRQVTAGPSGARWSGVREVGSSAIGNTPGTSSASGRGGAGSHLVSLSRG
jgi:hypothetical protein